MKLSVALWWGLTWGTCAMAPDAQAWSNHTVGSYLALQALPQLRDAPEVEVEALESFLVQEHVGLVVLLERQEQFAREHFAHYPPRPDELKLGEQPGTIRARHFSRRCGSTRRSTWRWRSSRWSGKTSPGASTWRRTR